MMALYVKIVFVVLSTFHLKDIGSNAHVYCDSDKACKCVSQPTGIFADCSNLKLTNSPKFFNNVISVDLSGNILTLVPSNEQLTNTIRFIDLSRNLIKNFSMDGKTVLFSDLIHLETLNLSSNSIQLSKNVYFENMFVNFTDLKVLDISNNTHGSLISPVSSQLLSRIFKQITSLEHLAIDGLQNISFGQGFSTLRNLRFLKIAGICHSHRLVVMEENYFENFPYIENLDISSVIDWTINVPSTTICSLYNIYQGSIGKLTNLKYLDLSYNRVLGLCGFQNISRDLPSTKIRSVRASFLQCEGGTSSILFCDDIKYLHYTKLKEFYFEGNNIAFAEPGILSHLPQSLEVISLKNNRWVRSEMYTYIGFRLFVNLKSVDMSNLNEHQMSHSTNYQYCDNFVREVNCEKQRATSLGNSMPPQQWHICPFPNETTLVGKDFKLKERKVTYFSNLTTCDIPSDYMEYDIEFISVPPNVINITMNDSRLGRDLIMTIFSTTTIERLVLSNNNFYKMKGPICNGTNITYLDLSGNRCFEFTTYLFGYLPALKTLLLNDNILGNSKILYDNDIGDIFANQSNLLHLNLASNRIAFLPVNIFWNLTKLQVLILKNNILVTFDVSISHMKNLQYIDLSDNQILNLSPTVIKTLDKLLPRYISVDFSNNHFQCNCDSISFVNWLVRRDMLNYTCTYKDKNINIKNGKFRLDKDCASSTSLIGIVISLCCVIVILAIVIAVLVYCYCIVKRQHSRGYHRMN